VLAGSASAASAAARCSHSRPWFCSCSLFVRLMSFARSRFFSHHFFSFSFLQLKNRDQKKEKKREKVRKEQKKRNKSEKESERLYMSE
jgi:hypothetical protein